MDTYVYMRNMYCNVYQHGLLNSERENRLAIESRSNFVDIAGILISSSILYKLSFFLFNEQIAA